MRFRQLTVPTIVLAALVVLGASAALVYAATTIGLVKNTIATGDIYGLGLALGPDDFARVAYIDLTSSNPLMLARCTDEDCSSPVITMVSTSTSGDYPGSYIMTLGADDFPRIVYLDDAYVLKFVRCGDADCTATTTTIVDSNVANAPGVYGQAVILGDDNLPRVAYANCGDNNDVHFVRFSGEDTIAINTNLSSVGVEAGCTGYAEVGMAIGPDHFARIVYLDGDDNQQVKMARCTDADCTAPVITIVDANGNNSPGYYGAFIKFGSDGFPRISHVDGQSPNTVHYVVCSDTDCTNPTNTNLVDTNGNMYNGIGMNLRDGDLASITYMAANGSFHIINCSNASCSSFDDVTVDVVHVGDGDSGGMALIIGSDDLPRAAYSDSDTGLYFARLGTLDGEDFTAADPEPESTSTRGSGGGQSVSNRVQNLQKMGKLAEAQALQQQWPAFFANNLIPAITSTPSLIAGFYQLNDSGEEVKALQQFLNTHGFPVATEGDGSTGQETSFFGLKTYQAVVKFQAANNLPATGYFGPLTRARINMQGN